MVHTRNAKGVCINSEVLDLNLYIFLFPNFEVSLSFGLQFVVNYLTVLVAETQGLSVTISRGRWVHNQWTKW